MTNNGRERATLDRTLGIGTVVLNGFAYMTPLIVLGTYGVVAHLSNGTVLTAYLVTLIAMLFTPAGHRRGDGARTVSRLDPNRGERSCSQCRQS